MKAYERGYLRARAGISADKDGDIFGQKREISSDKSGDIYPQSRTRD